MKISKNVYLSLLIISISIILVFCLKIIFFPSNNNSPTSNNNFLTSNNKSTLETNTKTILETNTKYFDELYSKYKKNMVFYGGSLTEKQFLYILHCFFVMSRLEVVDYGEMIIYILEKNSSLIESFELKNIDNFTGLFGWFCNLDKILFYRNEDQSVDTKNFEELKSKIRNNFKVLGKSNSVEKFNKLRNDIQAVFKSTSLKYNYLIKLMPLFNIYIIDTAIFTKYKIIKMNPALLYAINYIKLNWSKNLSTDMINNIFSFEFTKPEGTFSYFYISLYSWLYFFIDEK